MARNNYYTAREMNPEDIERDFLFGLKKLLDTEGSSDLWIVAQTKVQIASGDFAEGSINDETIIEAIDNHIR